MIDYEKLLDEWTEKVLKEADKHQEIKNNQSKINHKYSYCSGFSDGMYMAIAYMSKMEKKHKKNMK